jgi:hypothetical protein
MSMDIAVWSERPFELLEQLPHADSWRSYGEEEFCFEGDGWQVTVRCSSDPPEDSVATKLASARYVAYLALEPIEADASGYSMLEEVARGLARLTGGVWVDPDGDAHFHDEGAF